MATARDRKSVKRQREAPQGEVDGGVGRARRPRALWDTFSSESESDEVPAAAAAAGSGGSELPLLRGRQIETESDSYDADASSVTSLDEPSFGTPGFPLPAPPLAAQLDELRAALDVATQRDAALQSSKAALMELFARRRASKEERDTQRNAIAGLEARIAEQAETVAALEQALVDAQATGARQQADAAREAAAAVAAAQATAAAAEAARDSANSRLSAVHSQAPAAVLQWWATQPVQAEWDASGGAAGGDAVYTTAQPSAVERLDVLQTTPGVPAPAMTPRDRIRDALSDAGLTELARVMAEAASTAGVTAAGAMVEASALPVDRRTRKRLAHLQAAAALLQLQTVSWNSRGSVLPRARLVTDALLQAPTGAQVVLPAVPPDTWAALGVAWQAEAFRRVQRQQSLKTLVIAAVLSVPRLPADAPLHAGQVDETVRRVAALLASSRTAHRSLHLALALAPNTDHPCFVRFMATPVLLQEGGGIQWNMQCVYGTPRWNGQDPLSALGIEEATLGAVLNSLVLTWSATLFPDRQPVADSGIAPVRADTMLPYLSADFDSGAAASVLVAAAAQCGAQGLINDLTCKDQVGARAMLALALQNARFM